MREKQRETQNSALDTWIPIKELWFYTMKNAIRLKALEIDNKIWNSNVCQQLLLDILKNKLHRRAQ